MLRLSQWGASFSQFDATTAAHASSASAVSANDPGQRLCGGTHACEHTKRAQKKTDDRKTTPSLFRRNSCFISILFWLFGKWGTSHLLIIIFIGIHAAAFSGFFVTCERNFLIDFDPDWSDKSVLQRTKCARRCGTMRHPSFREISFDITVGEKGRRCVYVSARACVGVHVRECACDCFNMFSANTWLMKNVFRGLMLLSWSLILTGIQSNDVINLNCQWREWLWIHRRFFLRN